MMKILHTSDWHLGRSLYGKKRYEEFRLFLTWLREIIEVEKVDIVLIAGDIFDTAMPGNRAQAMYYRFLFEVAKSECKKIVVIGGNHDSPTFLDAPKELLHALEIAVVGQISKDIEDEIVVIEDTVQEIAVIIAAVPYLRDRDIRIVEPGETVSDKNRKLVEGLSHHYETCYQAALKKKQELLHKGVKEVLLIGMGHLFATGGKTLEGDGVRDLYVGSLAQIGVEQFVHSFDYMALGHLHVPQCVGGSEVVRYSGSPLPMGFGEAKQQKSVEMVCWNDEAICVERFAIPCFQRLQQVRGEFEEILDELQILKHSGENIWVDIEHTGLISPGQLREKVDECVKGSEIEVLRVVNRGVKEYGLEGRGEEETLEDLNVFDVFERCLESRQIFDQERKDLQEAYREIIVDMENEDKNAE